MDCILKESKLKRTRARQIILDIIESSDFPISAQAVYEKAVKQIDINLSTVYRTLGSLSDSGALIKQVRHDGVAYYQENKHDHIHLLICTICGKKITIDVCPLEKMFKKIAEDTDFKLTSHSIELYGLCPECQKVAV